ncbi:MAG: type II toxin-antitoxin system VapC family toxin [Deltaproteobacteria bacterium]|nr:type II toxin-antitoxin system VapC family toxin [Deltaproteobacteria bacterium]
MRILLDTHVWLWWLLGSDRLATRERRALDRLASRAQLRLAAVSLWEAQMLYAKGRLTLDRPFDVWIREAAGAAVIEIAPLDVEIVIALNGLPASFHGDPADRLIVATARAHCIPLATYDRVIRKSRAAIIWNIR